MKLYQYYKSFSAATRLRALVFAAAAVGALFLLVALVAQYGFGLHPCELCLAQRVPYAIIALFGVIAGIKLQSQRKLRIAALVCAWLFIADGGIAIYHSGVEMGYFTGPSACTNNDKPGETLEEMRAALMKAQLVPCDQPMAYVLGLSMASWNALAALAAAAVIFAAIVAL